MYTIFRYEIPLSGGVVNMPMSSSVLTVGEQRGAVFVWAMVDTTQKEFEPRAFEIFGTGHTIPTPAGLVYRGTAMLDGGALVLHVFERG